MSVSELPAGVDPRTPVLVGVGQVERRLEAGDTPVEAVELMAEAARVAAADAGATGLLGALETIRAVRTLSAHYADPARLVAERVGADPRQTVYTEMGGNYVQTLLNRTASEIAAGQLEVALLVGGEVWRTRTRTRAAGEELTWTRQGDGVVPDLLLGADDPPLNHPAEVARGLIMPTQLYPMFDVALRASLGLGVDAHRDRIAELWSRFSEVAAANPHAWIRARRTPTEVREATPDNRMIGFPYTKAMCSNNNVDQAAALLVCSAERAARAGVASDRWVFLHAGADAHDHWFVSHRADLHSSPAIRLAGAAALALAGVGVDDLAHVDLYSCFPSAVQIAAAELGLGLDRSLTVTGGMSFAGGPWNNYPMHAVATLVERLRADPGSTGLCTANGGYTTKHSFGVYSTTPPAAGTFRHAHPQADVDALPRRELAEAHQGPATLEAYTVMHDRDGAPERALAAVLTPDGRRAWASATDAGLMARFESEEMVGVEVTLDAEGTLAG